MSTADKEWLKKKEESTGNSEEKGRENFRLQTPIASQQKLGGSKISASAV